MHLLFLSPTRFLSVARKPRVRSLAPWFNGAEPQSSFQHGKWLVLHLAQKAIAAFLVLKRTAGSFFFFFFSTHFFPRMSFFGPFLRRMDSVSSLRGYSLWLPGKDAATLWKSSERHACFSYSLQVHYQTTFACIALLYLHVSSSIFSEVNLQHRASGNGASLAAARACKCIIYHVRLSCKHAFRLMVWRYRILYYYFGTSSDSPVLCHLST
jgi:hypothetical protein